MPKPVKRSRTLLVAASVALAALAGHPAGARAATYEELQQRVEEATAAYDEAMAHVDEIEGEIGRNEEKIAELEGQLPEQRARAAESLKALYKMQQSSDGLIELVLTAEDFNDFIATITYLDRIQSRNITVLQDLDRLADELQEAKDTLAARKAQATHEADAARAAQEEAVAAREEVRQQAVAAALAAQEEAQAAIEQAAKEAEAGKTFTNASGQQVQVSVPSSPIPSVEPIIRDADAPAQEEPKEEKVDKPKPQNAEESEPDPEPAPPAAPVVSEKDKFVAKWAPRIDAYLSGSPLGGHGRTFAEAAWDSNVDPRWSPAISCIESGKGTYCFRPHNAWGWGNASWGNWDSAIRDHVAGLASIYGYTITLEAAKMYCPPTYQEWYSSVLAEMSYI